MKTFSNTDLTTKMEFPQTRSGFRQELERGKACLSRCMVASRGPSRHNTRYLQKRQIVIISYRVLSQKNKRRKNENTKMDHEILQVSFRRKRHKSLLDTANPSNNHHSCWKNTETYVSNSFGSGNTGYLHFNYLSWPSHQV